MKCVGTRICLINLYLKDITTTHATAADLFLCYKLKGFDHFTAPFHAIVFLIVYLCRKVSNVYVLPGVDASAEYAESAIAMHEEYQRNPGDVASKKTPGIMPTATQHMWNLLLNETENLCCVCALSVCATRVLVQTYCYDVRKQPVKSRKSTHNYNRHMVAETHDRRRINK